MKRIKKATRVYTAARLAKACDLAIFNGAPNLKHVINLLENNLEEDSLGKPVKQLPLKKPQKNIRGSQYFDPDLAGHGGTS